MTEPPEKNQYSGYSEDSEYAGPSGLNLAPEFFIEAKKEYRAPRPECDRTPAEELFFCVKQSVRKAFGPFLPGASPDDLLPGGRSFAAEPKLLISERCGTVCLRTNYFKLLGKGTGDIVNVRADNAFLLLFASSVLSAYPVKLPLNVPLPDDGFPAYSGALALNTALRAGFFRTDGSAPGLVHTAPDTDTDACLSLPERNILLRLFQLIYTLASDPEAKGRGESSASPRHSEAPQNKSRTGKPISKLSGPLFTLAVSKAACDYIYSEALTLACAGSFLLRS